MHIRIACMVLFLFGSHASVRAQLIVNGDFEIPPVAVGAFATIPVGGEPPGFGWKITNGDVDVEDQTLFGHVAPAFSGSRYLDLNGTQPGTIAQAFATNNGGTYQVSFVYGNNWVVTNMISPATATVRVYDTATGIDLVVPVLISHGNSATGNMNWTPANFTFSATSASSTLEFKATNPGIGGIHLDAINVTGGGGGAPPPKTGGPGEGTYAASRGPSGGEGGFGFGGGMRLSLPMLTRRGDSGNGISPVFNLAPNRAPTTSPAGGFFLGLCLLVPVGVLTSARVWRRSSRD